MKIQNPILGADYPDPDVIRVEDTYYMVSTTMHFMPGAVILRSFDLIHWETLTHVYDVLDSTPAQRLAGMENIYGKGMWAPTIRYHDGVFYICFVANDTGKTYLFKSSDIRGPWYKQNIEGFYHDCSLLFDDDERVYIVYGNSKIHLTELNQDLTGSKPGGLNRVIITETQPARLGYEGAHMYKINGKYYVFLIHSPGTKWFRREACFMAESITGEFKGRDVLADDLGYCGQGVAQGGIVDTPDGSWYGVLFQDRGAVGRIPILIPVRWDNDFPVFGENGKIPMDFSVRSTRPGHKYAPLYSSDDFYYDADENGDVQLNRCWEFNHQPDHTLWSVTERPGIFQIRSGKLAESLEQAANTLTQRMPYPVCEAQVTVDGSKLGIGDYAGICALQGCFGFLAVKREWDGMYLVMTARAAEDDTLVARKDGNAGKEYARIKIGEETVTLRLRADFTQMKDEVEFYFWHAGNWEKVGITHKLYFKLDHFTGCRVGLFLYSTIQTGGSVGFGNFKLGTTLAEL